MLPVIRNLILYIILTKHDLLKKNTHIYTHFQQPFYNSRSGVIIYFDEDQVFLFLLLTYVEFGALLFPFILCGLQTSYPAVDVLP